MFHRVFARFQNPIFLRSQNPFTSSVKLLNHNSGIKQASFPFPSFCDNLFPKRIKSLIFFLLNYS
ncbi:hypothetical protein DLM78_15780 [Leptospira stimsonii]|uniref:Uncharacterized protein n=1 Tax=Leptospira stimsonii TaxID=2202203 RepID=A0A8B3CQX9_9LEPT|nr:hypothetical protein DLM78_15780 [Leptospira stimsonii]